MKRSQGTRAHIVMDIAPLWELQFTGISNVVCEMTARALEASAADVEFRFSAFQHIVDRSVVEACVEELNGAKLREAFETGKVKQIEKDTSLDVSRYSGLFLHVKPPFRRFRKEAHLYYDLSYLSVPETHSEDTVRFHLHELASQVATTDQFFTISRSTALDLQWYFDVPEEKVQVTYLGHNTDMALADEFIARTHGRTPEPFIFVLGTIEPRKNVAMLLGWLQKNPQILDSCRFVFCGRDGWGESFDGLVVAHGLQEAQAAGRILHFGYVSQKQKAALLSAAEALIYPSMFEGFGLPVLEAMAQSVPVLASCSTSIPEVLGPEGFYFDPYSIDSFTQAFSEFSQAKRSGVLKAHVQRMKERAALFTYDNMFHEILTTMVAL